MTGSSLSPAPAVPAAAFRAALLVGIAYALTRPWLDVPARAAHVPATLLYLAGLALAAAVFRALARGGGAAPEEVGPPPRRAGGRAADGVLVVLPAVLAVSYSWYVVAPLGFDLGAARETRPWSGEFFAMTAGYLLAAPVVEEYYFRQLLYRELQVVFGRAWLFVAANAVWFAAVHGPASIPGALAVGAGCALLRWRTGGLALPIAAHLLANLALDVAGMFR
ncbi:MAG TPA: CPBP family intramembrane glutamic endopeptidase [Longimicrobium sp.]|nr:CPBP family intramembrane glutamic endopeptidase [Longimicrobium sp.]